MYPNWRKQCSVNCFSEIVVTSLFIIGPMYIIRDSFHLLFTSLYSGLYISSLVNLRAGAPRPRQEDSGAPHADTILSSEANGFGQGRFNVVAVPVAEPRRREGRWIGKKWALWQEIRKRKANPLDTRAIDSDLLEMS
jgi:hypothetical protein